MAVPPGGTFFDIPGKRSFVDVPMDESKDNAISTTEFLEASEALTGLFDILGGVAFQPVKSDIQGNITVSSSSTTTTIKLNCTSHVDFYYLCFRNSATANSNAPSTPARCNPSCAPN